MVININYITQSGYVVYGSIELSEDWTMCELVNLLRSRGVKKFKLDTMKRFVDVI